MFLEINGIPIKVQNVSPSYEYTYKGNRERTTSGQMADSRRGGRRMWSVTTSPLTNVEASSVIGMVHGRAHVITFYDGLSASTSLNPTGYSSVTWENGSTPDPDQSGRVKILAGGSLVYDPKMRTDEQAIFWKESSDGVTWSSCSRSALGKRRNGASVTDGAFLLLPTISGGGVVTTTNQSGSTAYLSELVFALFVPDLTQQNNLSLHTTENRWGEMPILRARGDMINNGEEVFCMGKMKDDKRRHIMSGASHEASGSVLSFTLEEVTPPHDYRR